jgi:hypothetical protein
MECMRARVLKLMLCESQGSMELALLGPMGCSWRLGMSPVVQASMLPCDWHNCLSAGGPTTTCLTFAGGSGGTHPRMGQRLPVAQQPAEVSCTFWAPKTADCGQLRNLTCPLKVGRQPCSQNSVLLCIESQGGLFAAHGSLHAGLPMANPFKWIREQHVKVVVEGVRSFHQHRRLVRMVRYVMCCVSHQKLCCIFLA